MRKWKIMLCMALAGALTFTGPSAAWAKLSDYDAETAARLQDNNLEYDELENLIREYNPEISYAYSQLEFNEDDTASTVRAVRNDIEDNDYKDLVKTLKQQKKQLEAMPDSEEKAKALLELNTTIKGLEGLISAPASTTKATDKQLEKARKQLDTGVKSALKGTQTLMISYDNLRAQVQTLEKVVELQKEALEAAKLQAGLGIATDTGVLQAQSDLLSSQSQLDNLRNLAGNLRTQLCLLTGWKADSVPEIGSVPVADPSKIASIDLTADIQKAIGNNQTLISQRHASSTKSTAAIDNRLKNIDVSEQQLTVEMQRLYQVMQQKKILNDAAETAYQKALLAKGAAERQYQLNMLSKLQYLGAEVQYYQAEGARKSADTALLQAMLDYDWAVQGFVSVPQ